MIESRKKFKVNDVYVMSIYKITEIKSGKFYFGQTQRDPKIRWQEHLTCAKNLNYKYNSYLYNSINKYNPFNFIFEVIFQCKTLEQLNWAENYFIVKYNPTLDKDVGFNLTTGGDVIKMSDESKMKMSKSRSGKDNHFYGKTHTEKTKKILSNAHTGKKRSLETRRNISKNLTGKKNKSKNKGTADPYFGKKRNDKTKLNMKNTYYNLYRKKFFDIPEELEKLKSLYNSGYTFSELATLYNMNRATISSAINGTHAYRKK